MNILLVLSFRKKINMTQVVRRVRHNRFQTKYLNLIHLCQTNIVHFRIIVKKSTYWTSFFFRFNTFVNQ